MAMWQWKMLSQTFTSLGFPRAILANLPVKVVVDPDRVNSANNIIALHDFAPKCFLLVSGSITAIIARDIVCGLKHLIGKTCQWSSKKQSKANQGPKTWIGWQRKCKEKWSGPSCLQPVFWRKNIIDVFPPEFWLKQESGRWPQVKTLAARSVNIVSLAESAGSNGFLTPSFTNLRISVIHLHYGRCQARHKISTSPSSTSSAETHSQFVWFWPLLSRWQGSNDNSTAHTASPKELQLARRYSWQHIVSEEPVESDCPSILRIIFQSTSQISQVLSPLRVQRKPNTSMITCPSPKGIALCNCVTGQHQQWRLRQSLVTKLVLDKGEHVAGRWRMPSWHSLTRGHTMWQAWEPSVKTFYTSDQKFFH